MSSTFNPPPGPRAVGAIAGLAIGGIGPIGVALERWPTPLDWAMAGALLALAPILGWSFAPEAAGPRLANGLRAALWVALSGVALGAFTTAGIMAATSGDDLATILAGTVGLGLAGLLFLGVPALLPAIVLALLWVGIVRLATRVLGARQRVV